MPTLNRITSNTKSILKWIGIIIVIIILVRIGGILKEWIFPTPKAPPTVAFGKLPSIKFPKNTTSQNLSYSVDTLSGTLPTFPDRISVYKITPLKPDLLSFEKAKDMASNLGFSYNGTPISQDIYQWESNDSLSRKIAVNIFSLDFTIASSFLSTASSNLNINKDKAISVAKSFLENLSSFPTDIDNGKTKATFFSKKNYVLVPVSKISDATDVRIDFFQSDINKLPIFYPNPLSSSMNFIVENAGDTPKVVMGNFIHQEISQESATYPIKTADQALSELKEKKAYIASYSGTNQAVLIKDAFLGYYLSDKRQDYLIPIIVFQGDNDFVAYIPAVTGEWLNN